MTEDEAICWLRAHFGEACVQLLKAYVDAVIAENQQQNLIAPSTIASIWVRHIVDSAQLVPLAPSAGTWLDIGSGAGLPGLVAAILRREPTILIEPRRRRAEFLLRCTADLGLDHVTVVASKVERISIPAAAISARAVAQVEELLRGAAACSNSKTVWLLPRGQVRGDEFDHLKRRWRGLFHMKQSITDPASSIMICEGVAPR